VAEATDAVRAAVAAEEEVAFRLLDRPDEVLAPWRGSVRPALRPITETA